MTVYFLLIRVDGARRLLGERFAINARGQFAHGCASEDSQAG